MVTRPAENCMGHMEMDTHRYKGRHFAHGRSNPCNTCTSNRGAPVVVGGGVLDGLAQLVAALVDAGLLAAAVQDDGVVLADGHLGAHACMHSISSDRAGEDQKLLHRAELARHLCQSDHYNSIIAAERQAEANPCGLCHLAGAQHMQLAV